MPYRMLPEDEPAPWGCSDCGQRSSAPGRCARCGEEPLLDLHDPEVVVTLQGQDQRRIEARRRRNIFLSLPFGIAAAAALLLPFPDPNVVRAPIAGIAVSWLAMLLLRRLSPATRLWSAFAQASAQDQSEEVRRFEAAHRFSALPGIGIGVGAFFGAVVVAVIAVNIVGAAAPRAAEVSYNDRVEAAHRWNVLRKCLVVRGGPRDEVRAAFAVWNETADLSSSPSTCDAEATLLYEQAKKYRVDGHMALALESVAGCNVRCVMPTLDLARV